VEGAVLADVLAWLEPRALLLALAMPPAIRVLGHLIPEELFMVAMGVLAARSHSPEQAVLLLGAVTLSHVLTDQLVYGGGRWLHPRLSRFPRIGHRLAGVAARLNESPAALAALVPARVLPCGRAAWLAAAGIAGVRWHRFLFWDVVAVIAHLATWSGLGWWLAGDLARLESTAVAGGWIGAAMLVTVVAAVPALMVFRSRPDWQVATVQAARRLGRSIRQFGWRWD
jgi:membrane protein DedA with SNARE-associated domain